MDVRKQSRIGRLETSVADGALYKDRRVPETCKTLTAEDHRSIGYGYSTYSGRVGTHLGFYTLTAQLGRRVQPEAAAGLPLHDSRNHHPKLPKDTRRRH